MRFFLILITFFFSFNGYAFDSTMTLTLKELNQNELIARGGTGRITVAMRVIQLQLRASGCSQPIIMSPDMFQEREDYRFNVTSDNCKVVTNTNDCESGYAPRNLIANPNSSNNKVIGAEKYIVCLKKASGKSERNDKIAD